MKKLTWKTMLACEKDAAVARHIFKATEFHLRGDVQCARFKEGLQRVPHYTTNPAALAEVKERFGEWLIEKNGDNMEVFIFTENTRYHGEAPTEGEAFAIAALRASGVEVES